MSTNCSTRGRQQFIYLSMLFSLLLLPSQAQQALKKTALPLSEAVCNDGSPAYLYQAINNDSNLIVYFQGGYQCYSQQSCDQRFKDSPHLMSSKDYKDSINLGGILDSSPTKNRAFYNFSKVFLPYCTSDVFIANFQAWGYTFRGQLVVQAVITHLLKTFPNLYQLVIAGGSAGGRAAAFNILSFKSAFSKTSVKGIFDSPLWLDIMPRYDSWPGSTGLAKFMLSTYNFQMPSECLQNNKNHEFRCFMTQYYLRNLKVQHMVISSLSDAFIIPMFVQKPQPFDHQSMAMAYSISNIIRTQQSMFSLIYPQNGYFSLNCYSHSTSLSDLFWSAMTDSGVSMNEAVWMWMNGKKVVVLEECEGWSCGSKCSGVKQI